MAFPDFPGIPALRSSASIAGGTLLAAGLIQRGLNFLKPQWGIYKSDGQTLAITPDSFVSINYANVQNVSQYPVEKGSFTSYNKVKTPFKAIVKLAKGGSRTDRASFIAALDALADSFDLFILITPEKTYKNVSIERLDYNRDAMNGAGMMVVNVYMTEIREAVSTTSAAKNPANASAQPTQSNGQVQAGSSVAAPAGVR